MVEKEQVTQAFEQKVWSIIEAHNNANAHTFKKHLLKLATQQFSNIIESAFSIFAKELDDPENIEWEKYGFFRPIEHYIKDSSQQYNQHKQLFKKAFHEEGALHFDPLKMTTLESLNDGINQTIYMNQVRKFAHSFVRSYKHLLNDNSYELFSVLMESDYTREQIQQDLRKIATYQSSSDLNNALKKIIGDDHRPDAIRDKIEQCSGQAHIVHDEDNLIIVHIEDFQAAQDLGSTQWCIGDNVDVFEQYLYEKPSKINYIDDGDDFNEIMGKQFFAYDFKKGQENPAHMIGFTMAANGEIVAAHDKNDDDIERSLKEGEVIDNTIIKDLGANIDYDMEDIKRTLFPDTEEMALQNPFYIIANTKNPLNVFVSLCNDSFKQGDYEIINDAKHFIAVINTDDALFLKSAEDYFDFGDISASQMLKDMLDYHHILCRLEELKNELEETTPEEEYEELVNGIQSCKEDDLTIEMGTQAHQLFGRLSHQSGLSESFQQQLQDPLISKVLFLNHGEQIVDALSYDLKYLGGDIDRMLEKPDSSLMELKESLLNNFAPHVIELKEEDISKQAQTVQKVLALHHCLRQPEPQDEVENFLMTKIADNQIHFNKLLGNITQVSKKLAQKAGEYANNNPNCFEKINNDIVQSISHDPVFVETLNDNARQSLNQAIHENSLNFGSLKSVFNVGNPIKDQYDFFERMAYLKDNGILDDAIVKKHYNPSQTCFGDKSKENLLIQSESNKQRPRP